MKIKSPQTLISESLQNIKTITADEALKLSKNDQCTLIDIRDKPELEQLGAVENSHHISRGLLEFSIHPHSEFVQSNSVDLSKEIVLFCAAGGRSALAAKTLKDMGFENVSHIDGGFGLMMQSGFKIKT